MYKRYAIFLIPYVLLFFLLGEFLFYYAGQTGSSYLKNIWDLRMGKVSCLIMGDSHTDASLRDNISNCKNISVGGISIPIVRDAVLSAQKSNNLKYVILSLDPHNFAGYRTTLKNNLFKNIAEAFIPNFNPMTSSPILRKYFIQWLKEKIIIVLGRDLKKESNWIDLSEKSREKIIKTQALKHTPISNLHESEYADIYLDLVDVLVSEDIKVCFVRAPVVNLYEEKLFENFEKSNWFDLIKKAEARGAKFVDYKMIVNEMPLHFFKNQDHLNEAGAEFFAPRAYKACFE